MLHLIQMESEKKLTPKDKLQFYYMGITFLSLFFIIAVAQFIIDYNNEGFISVDYNKLPELIIEEDSLLNNGHTQEYYKAMVLSKIVPIGYGKPNQYDIDTKLNLIGEGGETYRLYESGKFPTEGQLFVSNID